MVHPVGIEPTSTVLQTAAMTTSAKVPLSVGALSRHPQLVVTTTAIAGAPREIRTHTFRDFKSLDSTNWPTGA